MAKTIRIGWVVAVFLLALFFAGTPVYAQEGKKDVKAETAKPGATPVKAPVFTKEQLKLKELMTQVLETSKKVNVKGKAGSAARRKVEASVDWTRVAQTCLDLKLWNKQSTQNRTRFSRLLKDIISLTAYSRMSSFWEDTTYSIKNVEIKGATAVVATNFNADDEDYVLEYFLKKSGGRWRIFDLSFDEDKYSENIREQINAFLKENKFSNLLKRLEKRKADLKTESKKKAS